MEVLDFSKRGESSVSQVEIDGLSQVKLDFRVLEDEVGNVSNGGVDGLGVDRNLSFPRSPRLFLVEMSNFR